MWYNHANVQYMLEKENQENQAIFPNNKHSAISNQASCVL